MKNVKRSGNEQKAAASKKHQDVDGASIKEVQENKSAAVIKDKKPAKPIANKTPDKEDQVVLWASGGYSVDKKNKK